MDSRLFLSVFLPLFLLYLRTLSPTVPLEDGGEMVRAAHFLGVTHPPGYPLYCLLGKIFTFLPFRNVVVSPDLGAPSPHSQNLPCPSIP